jgi:hypothetical protein
VGVRARLLWRLLAVPRLILAIGVFVVAVVAVALPRRRRRRPLRLPPTSGDPVADALADAKPVSRSDEPELDVNDLRWIVSVAELEPIDEAGHNTVISLDDEVSSYADVDDDGLDGALAEQPGIDAVLVDGEYALVRSVLSLPDVHAAAIRALLAINRSPRLPRQRPLPRSVMSTVADGIATTMAEHGFAGRLRMSLDADEAQIDPYDRPGPGFYRVAEDRLVQVVRLRNGDGRHNDDATIVGGHVGITVEVVEIATTDVAESIELEHGCEVVAGERILSASYWVPATIDGVERVLVSTALPLCESTTSRAAIVDRWVIGLPWHVPDRLRWEAADIAARWGFRKHARDLVTYGARRLTQAAAVKAKHRL